MHWTTSACDPTAVLAEAVEALTAEAVTPVAEEAMAIRAMAIRALAHPAGAASYVASLLYCAVAQDISIDLAGLAANGSVSISFDAVAALPDEPSTWAMMLLGLTGVGFMAHRRKAKASIDGHLIGDHRVKFRSHLRVDFFPWFLMRHLRV